MRKSMPRGNANYGETTEVMFPVRRVIGIGVALIAAVFAAAAVVRPEGITLLHIGVALVVVVIGLAPGIAQMVTKPSRIARFPLMALTGAFYAAFFGAPVMVIGVLRSDDREGYRFLSNASVEQLDLWILVLITAGLSLLLVTWLTVRHLLDPLLPRYRIVVQGDLAARILAWALLLIAIAYPAFPVLSTLPSVGQIAFPAGVAGFAILMLASYRGGLGVWERRAFLWIALPVWLVELILHGSVTPVLLIAVLWIAMYWRRNGSLPWKVIAVFLVSAILVYASLGIYRDLIWTTSAGHTTAAWKELETPDRRWR